MVVAHTHTDRLTRYDRSPHRVEALRPISLNTRMKSALGLGDYRRGLTEWVRYRCVRWRSWTHGHVIYLYFLAFKHPLFLGSSERGVRNEREPSAERKPQQGSVNPPVDFLYNSLRPALTPVGRRSGISPTIPIPQATCTCHHCQLPLPLFSILSSFYPGPSHLTTKAESCTASPPFRKTR